MELRDYQVESIKNIDQAWDEGHQHLLMVLPTGSGKTIVLSEVLKRRKIRVLLCAHRSEILCQLSLTLGRFDICHNLTIGSNYADFRQAHKTTFGHDMYIDRINSNVVVASVDTIHRYNHWFEVNKFDLIIFDEGHHVLRDNKWGKILNKFPDIKSLHLTATPMRADGKGLGKEAKGFIDKMIVGPSTRTLMRQGHLAQYKIYGPKSNLDLSAVKITATGDFSPEKLREAVHNSTITGRIVENYKKFSPGIKGVVFAVSVEECHLIANNFNSEGIKAAVISGTTPTAQRARIMQNFRNDKIMILVNVDILGEGTDVPEIGVVILARPSKSLGLVRQQIGRCLRPAPGKSHGIIIDHVNNILRHGLPDSDIVWTLDNRVNSRKTEVQVKIKTCDNPECVRVYESYHKHCPYCDHVAIPASRATPEAVEGDLIEIDRKVLEELRRKIKKIDDAPRVPAGLSYPARTSLMKKHARRQEVQKVLRQNIQLWALVLEHNGLDKSEIYRRFYYEFDIDIMTAQTLNVRDATELLRRMNENDIDFTTKME